MSSLLRIYQFTDGKIRLLCQLSPPKILELDTGRGLVVLLGRYFSLRVLLLDTRDVDMIREGFER